MMTFLIILHVTACVVLIGLVLIQRGRGAGLVESFAGVESMFGTKTSVFLTRITTIMSVVFFITCLTLAVLSVKQSKSLMRDVRSVKPKTDVVAPEAVKPEAAKTETVKPEAAKAPAPVVTLPAETVKPDATKVK
ncbi:MAG: preprotein translocase subunit SecG [Candidatus Omnitrophica bacterium]|nr:preprotein translocase subunit SecG [Candidatus Omnitrophota bacterium]